MSEQNMEMATTPDEEIDESMVDVDTGRPRSSAVNGGLRSPLDREISNKVGTLEPQVTLDNDDRTGKKISQWGAASRRRSYWKSLYY